MALLDSLNVQDRISKNRSEDWKCGSNTRGQVSSFICHIHDYTEIV